MDVTRIYLIGYMGCGKSYWGKRLAKALDFDFVDLDDLIEAREGITIPEIFSQWGEREFRKKEQEALLSSKNMKRSTLISTGGGTACFYDNILLMNKMGVTLFLEAHPAILKQNILKSNNERPIVRTIPENELEAYIANHLKERLPFYKKAQIKLNIDGLKLSDLVNLFN